MRWQFERLIIKFNNISLAPVGGTFRINKSRQNNRSCSIKSIVGGNVCSISRIVGVHL